AADGREEPLEWSGEEVRASEAEGAVGRAGGRGRDLAFPDGGKGGFAENPRSARRQMCASCTSPDGLTVKLIRTVPRTPAAPRGLFRARVSINALAYSLATPALATAACWPGVSA